MKKDCKRLVAVVVPKYSENLTPAEEISLRHLNRFLGHYDKFLIAPFNLTIPGEFDDFTVKRFQNKYFQCSETYSCLLLSRNFYKTFQNYEYILIYQLDSLVFSDQLLQWCNRGYDYIGAPWYRSELLKIKNWNPDEDSVGNGGFSLRRVSSFLEVLDRYERTFGFVVKKIKNYFSLGKYLAVRIPVKTFDFIVKGQSLSGMLRNVYIKEGELFYQKNEDVFWSFDAKKYYADFRIPDPDAAVSFAFDAGPRHCFEKNGHLLPFGCHGWAKYDRAFWETYLLK